MALIWRMVVNMVILEKHSWVKVDWNGGTGWRGWYSSWLTNKENMKLYKYLSAWELICLFPSRSLQRKSAACVRDQPQRPSLLSSSTCCQGIYPLGVEVVNSKGFLNVWNIWRDRKVESLIKVSSLLKASQEGQAGHQWWDRTLEDLQAVGNLAQAAGGSSSQLTWRVKPWP